MNLEMKIEKENIAVKSLFAYLFIQNFILIVMMK